ncbi:ferric reductase-like transmembrane protein [Planoprotostelium fungivorum]|uniref:Ferric reductase-like transmembrane protein n=1 Tax=Planoprotostelium fungivorum TaxID=1890364 RepID=A0A2P6NDQ7_9EUKA|nr:ferric reductase-like transmembrane protein [Planoprotostelium fungivorum]
MKNDLQISSSFVGQRLVLSVYPKLKHDNVTSRDVTLSFVVANGSITLGQCEIKSRVFECRNTTEGCHHSVHNTSTTSHNSTTSIQLSRALHPTNCSSILHGDYVIAWLIQDGNESFTGHVTSTLLANEKVKRVKHWYTVPSNLLGVSVGSLIVLSSLFKWIYYLRRKARDNRRAKWYRRHYDGSDEVEPEEAEEVARPLSLSEHTPTITAEEAALLRSRNPAGRFQSVLGWRVSGTKAALWTIMIAVFYLALNLAIVFALYPGWSFGKSFGSLAAANSALLGILATRNSVLGFLFRESYERLILYHRWLGVWVVLIVAFLHPFWYVKEFVQAGENVPFKLTEDHFMLYGTLGGLSGFFILLTSFEPIRRKMFEWFYYPHIFLFITFYVFGSLHSGQFRRWTIGFACIYGADRILRWVWGLFPSRITEISTVGQGEEEIIRLVIKKPFLSRVLGLYRSGGQYVFVNFPGVKFLEWHPYTICSKTDDNTLEIAIKPLGDQTKLLLQKINSNLRPHWARLDGPYGLLPYDWYQYYQVALIFGGIGVTPGIAILKDAFCGESKFNWRTRRICFIWIVRKAIQVEWFERDLQEIKEACRSRAGPIQLELSIYLTGKNQVPTDLPRGGISIMSGRPDLKSEFSDLSFRGAAHSTLVFACGPDHLTKKCWDLAQKEQRAGNNFAFHREVFDF